MHTHWLWTLNNPNNDETVIDIENIFYTCQQVKYTVFQLEQGEEGTYHFQGYTELARNQRLSFVRQLLPRAHWEPRRGTRAQAREYCMKEDTRIEGPWVIGEWHDKGQGRRTDIIDIHRRVKETNEPIASIIHNMNYQQVRLVETLAKYRKTSKEFEPKQVRWFYGATGTGKTRTAYEEMKEDFWLANKTSDWFDGYNGEEDVLIDDLRAGRWKYDFMLKLLDGYQIRVPIKGSFTIFRAKRIWITCPYTPDIAYAGQVTYHDNIAQLLRRITEIRKFPIEQEQEQESEDDEVVEESWFAERMKAYKRALNKQD